MKILFDSHALFWFLSGSSRFSARARRVVEQPDTVSLVSAVSAWEITNKVRLGKWPEAAALATDFAGMMVAEGLELLSITPEHAQLAGLMSGNHRDPFDRMLAAQSQMEQVPLITADPAFKEFRTQTIW